MSSANNQPTKLKNAIRTKYPGLFRILQRLRRPTRPIPFGLWIINIIFQRIFQLNGDVPWMVHFTSDVSWPENIIIGENVWVSFALSGGCYIQGINGITIGDKTLFAPGVKIISANHDIKDYTQHVLDKPIQIGNNCWIGANVVILPGVSLGDRCVVGAGSIVTRSFTSDQLIIGNPARSISNI